jgi:hypothetical protein
MEELQTTLEEPISLRDTIENAIEVTDTNEPTESTLEAPKTSRPRDESGKFAKSAPEAQDEATEVLEPETVQEVQAKPRPSSWKKDYEEHWGKLDPTLQDYIQQREADYAKGVSTYKNQWDSAQPLIRAIEPFAPILQQHNIDPAQWISNLGRAHSVLALGSPEQKQQMFAQLANDYGVSLNEVGGGYADPQFSLIAQELNQIKNQWNQFQTQQERTEQASLQNEIQSFSTDKPYFDEVRETMAGLLQAGMANDLQSAYDKAIRLNDNISQKVQAEQAHKSESDRQAKLASAKAKALSPKSSSPTASTSTGGKGASIRDELLKQFESSGSII